MGNGTKFKLSTMFPNVFSKIKGMAGKKAKGKGAAPSSSLGDWSDDMTQDFSTTSRDSLGDRSLSPVRTFAQNRDRHCPSPRGSSPLNARTYDIRFPIESPIRRGMKSRPVSPPRRSANSTDSGCCSYDATMALVPHDRVRKAVPLLGRCLQRSKCNSVHSEPHSDSELDVTDSEPSSARARAPHHQRARTMSVQLDDHSEWEQERARERDWSEPEQSSSSSARRRKNTGGNHMEVSKSVAGEPSPIHTVYCVQRSSTPPPPLHPGDSADYDCQRSAYPDFCREESQALSRRLSFATTEDSHNNNRQFEDTYTSFSSDEDFYKVRSGRNGHNRLRPTKSSKCHGNAGDSIDAEVSEDDDRAHVRRESALARTVRSASDGWARVQSRFADEEKNNARSGVFSHIIMEEDHPDVLTMAGVDRNHAAMCKREASLVKTVLSAKDWARENAKLSKAADIIMEYESYGLAAAIHRSKNASPIGEVEKHTKGRVDYKSCHRDLRDVADSLGYEHHFPQAPPPPLEEDYASDCYKRVQTEESDFETGVRPWDVEFPSFRSDSLHLGARQMLDRSGLLVELSELEPPTPRSQRFSSPQGRTRPVTTPPKKKPPSFQREPVSAKNDGRSASPRHQQQQDFLKAKKTSGRTPSPRQEVALNAGRKSSACRTPSPSPRQDAVGKVSQCTPSPRAEHVGRRLSSNSSNSPVARNAQDLTGSISKRSSGHMISSLAPGPPALAKNGSVKKLLAMVPRAEERASVGMDSVAVVKASYDPYQDFRASMVEMILENDIQSAEDLEDLLQCYLSLNSSEYHSIIVQVFSDIWRDIFDH